ncbi:twin-arginine translocation protein, TatA/E family subunit [Catenulispora acidiphila DSM 44928]|uniref:Sec-independent protein translocase protein TatA n=1 Tax=Catenulispora acidiphila (strain DSM 44928 / JCM 14897 / NBRC 102108 / NRRL B-24433 / ID139908) TaxID=479433 RepID=C7Q3N7_CATAD|nr:Sec-independent protein translocase subunit TatA [Catenulispora acidiphila]ACU75802.1 twin-arginine translocation protein, TatA/E family subunit [Catenulispora acidiphila DSM 44928]
MTGAFEPWHILLILAITVVLFGAKRLPVAARSMGQSLRIFKSELRQSAQDDAAEAEQASLPPHQDLRHEDHAVTDIPDRLRA